jgi:glycosyltransferase involved in cell wall biosynthesis
VVASAVGGIPEVIGSRGAGELPVGWCVPPRDSRSLAEAIIECLSDETGRRQRSERARRRAELEFGADRMVDATLDLYRELLARREAGTPSARSAGNRAA